MIYDIRLTIVYRYGIPSDRARTLVRLLPSDKPGRQVVPLRLLTVDPAPHERHDSTDFFGNTMTALAFHGPIRKMTCTLAARAERLSPPPALDLSPSLATLASEIAATRTLDALSPHHYLGPSPRIAPDPAIAAFARAHASPDMTALQVVRAIGAALHDTMRFDARATDVDTTPADAFANRHGVCQDFSHVMIAALRALGIPAGYVSGFLRTTPPEGRPRLEGADAMHAWVSAWCGTETGWTDYDPTNACIVARDHITVAQGRDYSDVAPVKGVVHTSGAQTSSHAVDVVPV